MSNATRCRILFAFARPGFHHVGACPPNTMESTVGIEWIVDAAGCRPSALRDVHVIRAIVERAVAELGLNVLGTPAWHVFGGLGGVTGLVMLSESHLAVHTYPEDGVATFNLYCCTARPEWPWETRLAESLGASEVTVRTVRRGDRARVEALEATLR